jgi:hypothetical protein
MSMASAFADATPRIKKARINQVKGRAARRSVERRSLLVELADPVKVPNAQPKLTMMQSRAAVILNSDLQAAWPSSGATVMSYGDVRGGNDDVQIIGVRKDYEAFRRYEDLKQFLQPAQRDLLGVIELHNFNSKATLATLPMSTGYGNPEAHKANVEGRIASLLDACALFYSSRLKQFLRAA